MEAQLNQQVSRRVFLTGAVATVAAAATGVLPAIAAPLENPCLTIGDVITPDIFAPYRMDCRLFLNDAQWSAFDAAGYDMSQFHRILAIPPLDPDEADEEAEPDEDDYEDDDYDEDDDY